MEQEKHRISVRLNGKEQTFKETEKEKSHTEIASSEDIFEPVERREPPTKIIDIGRIRKERRKERGSFWDDGNRDRSPKLPFKRKKKKGSRQKFSLQSLPVGLIAAAVSAIIVGISFGVMVLTIFTGDATSTTESTPVNANGTIDILAGQGTSSSIPDLSVSIVQGGAFSTHEKGQETVQTIRDAGFAAAITTNSQPYFLFIGLGQDRDAAAQISQLYQQQGQETYIKSFAVLSNDAKVENEQLVSFLQEGVNIFYTALQLSVKGIAAGELTEAEITNLVSSQQGWSGNLGSVIDTLSAEQEQSMTTFTNSLTESANYLEQYNEEKGVSLLWKVQNSLLQGLLAYDAFIEQLK